LVVNLGKSNLGQVRFSLSPLSRLVVKEQGGPGFESVEQWIGNIKSAWYQHKTPLGKQSNDVKRLRRAIAECRSGFAMTLISQPLEQEAIRQARVLPRGDWQNESGEVVVPNTPHFLTGYVSTPERRLNRLDLANWLVSRDNPLTARHYVNRTWKHFFGQGLSNVLDDLGNQGEWPSHLQLLDWLASEFQEDWDRKQITRLIVTSNTYKQKASLSNQQDAWRPKQSATMPWQFPGYWLTTG
jgi:hypothetical protein